MKVVFDEIFHFHPNFDESVPNLPGVTYFGQLLLKNKNCGGRGKKKSEILGPHHSGPHPSGTPPFGAPQLRALTFLGLAPPPFRALDWPKLDWPKLVLAKIGRAQTTMAKVGFFLWSGV